MLWAWPLALGAGPQLVSFLDRWLLGKWGQASPLPATWLVCVTALRPSVHHTCAAGGGSRGVGTRGTTVFLVHRVSQRL